MRDRRGDAWEPFEPFAALHAPERQARPYGLLRTMLERNLPTVHFAYLRRLLDRAEGHAPTGVCSYCLRLLPWRELINRSTKQHYEVMCRSCRVRYGEPMEPKHTGQRSRGQIVVEFALAFSLFMFIMLEGFQLWLISFRQQQLQYAAMQAAVAGAAEPAPPNRCKVAQDVFTVTFPRPADPPTCRAIGENFTVDASYNVAIVSPFHPDPEHDGVQPIESVQTARVLK